MAVYRIALTDNRGAIVHRELLVVHCSSVGRLSCMTPAALRRLVSRFREGDEGSVRELVRRHVATDLERVATRWQDAAASMARREHAMLGYGVSAATQLVQAGLFDQRAVKASAARSRAAALQLDEAVRRLDALASSAHLERSVDLDAVLVVSGGSPS